MDGAAKVGFASEVEALRAARLPEWFRQAERDDAHMRVVLAALMGPDANGVDVGAHVGDILSVMVRVAPNGRHVAFEARASAAESLRARFPTVLVHGAAASDVAGTADFTIVENMPVLSGLAPRAWPHLKLERKVVSVPTVRLDEVLTERVDVLKIDVEGSEAAVLAGAHRVLGEYQPCVLLEHGATIAGDSEDPEHSEIYAALAGAGLRVFDIVGEGPLTNRQFAISAASGRMWNFIARP
ncbi:MAG: FkbM family methyltransferase [Actinobacteria bacterium]|nr:FkbM family methyltransferase [Actinomycetota bacterium]